MPQQGGSSTPVSKDRPRTHQGREQTNATVRRPHSEIRSGWTVPEHESEVLQPSCRWDLMWQYLIDKKLPTLTPQQAKQRVDRGDYLLIDVRPTENYEEAHPEGAKVHIAVFQWACRTAT